VIAVIAVIETLLDFVTIEMQHLDMPTPSVRQRDQNMINPLDDMSRHIVLERVQSTVCHFIRPIV
jgi:hypothetical protein